MSSIRIAIDGPASSGKGTVARLVAQALDYAYVDTGAMYRAVAHAAQRAGVSWGDAPAVAALAARLVFDFAWDGASLVVRVDGEDVTLAIRAESVGQGASDVAAHPEVRMALLDRQRALSRAGGVVMDGRDIGTVVLPDAELKVFLDASPAERARRRQRELAARGIDVARDELAAELARRDAQDRARRVAPLKQAPDGLLLDTTGMSAAEAAEVVLGWATQRGAVRVRRVDVAAQKLP